jgi:hypothetical protein
MDVCTYLLTFLVVSLQLSSLKKTSFLLIVTAVPKLQLMMMLMTGIVNCIPLQELLTVFPLFMNCLL